MSDDHDLHDAILWLMGDHRGRLIMADLMMTTGALAPGAPAPLEFMAFREGLRSVGLNYLDMVNMLCPESLLLMKREHDARSDSEPARGGALARSRADGTGSGHSGR